MESDRPPDEMRYIKVPRLDAMLGLAGCGVDGNDRLLME